MNSSLLWSTVGAVGLIVSGCATTSPPLPLDTSHAATSGDKVAHLSMTSKAIRWEDIADALGEFQFKYDQTWLLANATQTTSSVDANRIDSLTATLAGIVAGQSVTKTNTVSQAAGVNTTTDTNQRTFASPTAPTGQTFIFQAPAAPGAAPAGSVGVDGETQIRQGSALAEIIAIENNRVKSLPIPAGYRAYFVNFQVQIAPLEHGLPYDTKMTLTFDDVPSGGKREHVFVLPLLANDVDEESKYTEISTLLREYGAQLQASGGLFGASANLQRVIESLEDSASTRPNSLYSIGVEPTPTGQMATAAWVRMGANHFGSTYEMVTRTHNVAVVIFVPLGAVKDDGTSPSIDRLIHYHAKFVYSDALPQTADHTRFSDLENSPLTGQVLVPSVAMASCPGGQDAVLTWATLQQSQTVTSVTSPAVAVVSLEGGRGYAWRKLEATLTTPKELVGGPLKLKALDIRPTQAGVQFVFPGHQDGLRVARIPQALFGTLTFKFIDTRDGLGGLSCTAENYRIAYFVAAQAVKATDAKKTAASDKKAAASKPGAAPSAALAPAAAPAAGGAASGAAVPPASDNNPPVVLTPHIQGPS